MVSVNLSVRVEENISDSPVLFANLRAVDAQIKILAM